MNTPSLWLRGSNATLFQSFNTGRDIPILDAVETEGTEGDPAQLRALLSDALLPAINANLIAMGEPPDILEVLIIDWALVP